MSLALYNAFSKIYSDNVNIYFKESAIPIDPDISLHTLIKSRCLKVSERSIFDKWIIDNYIADTSKESIMLWEEDVKANARQNIFAKHLVVMIVDDVLQFYKHGRQENELIFLTHSDDPKFVHRIHSFFKYGIRDPYFINASNKTLSQELNTALGLNIIPMIDDIKNFTNEPNEPCLSYLPIESNLTEGNTPAWDNFLYSMKSDIYRELFMAWVYSIFKAELRMTGYVD